MEIDTARAKEIETWIKDHPILEVAELKAQVELFGKNEYLPVYKVPLRLLIYNIRNGRFAAELMAEEQKLGRSLSPTIPEDAKTIQKLLLEQNEKETEELEKSLKAYGQLKEGIITFDGAVINANRRMAILSKLWEETKESKYEYLKVARLPRNVDEKDVWRIEAGLQFAKDLRLEYGPVNELLKLREGRRKRISDKEISRILMGRYTEKDVDDRLEVLKLIDSYLDYVGKPKQYQLFQKERNVEKFNSLRNNVLVPLETRKEVSEEELPKLMQAAFSLIAWKGNDVNPDVSHWDIRKLRDIAKNTRAKNTLLRGFKPDNLGQDTLEKLVDAFGLAKEISEATKDYEKPKRQAERALVVLESIDKNSKKLKEEEVQQILKKISEVVEQLLKRSRAK